MKISRDIARELLYLGVGENTSEWVEEGFPYIEVVHADLIETSRWSHIYERVYEDRNTGLFYRTTYSVGATESQDETPYENDGEEITLEQVFQKKKTIIEYVSSM